MNTKLPDEKKERIAKVIAHSGLCSRRDAEKMILEGRVLVNGMINKNCATKTNNADEIIVDGEKIKKKDTIRLWKYYKPSGLITSHKDEQGRKTVFNALPLHLPRLISVGRLDLNSEGLLLLTNNGDLSRLLEHPSHGWVRRYKLRVHGRINQTIINTLKKGLRIKGIRYAPVLIEEVKNNKEGANNWIIAKIKEGKNRELRVIMEHFGLKVNRLIRTSYGPFQLGSLKKTDISEVPYKVIKEQLGKELLKI
tara:strand:- start:31 stop:786 length:756 start_codon:yes stop_codon:yes gene_type:complete